ncbi:hypothetical protein [Flavobacterium sp. K5-23]|uniref:hypothetical protein n=1 Tax=Flavobacterium sp. K5-23 TaxID=2746225 RepID=UPI00200CEE92|nr:hypothetical protein [Flavobacterium sp. K5-23]UQD54850.1 hypothetical protein FLAK523_00025 [Flavobacterium sp. K5-23]
MKITKRDINVFVLGMLAFLAFETIYNWEESKSEFMRGWNDGGNTSETKSK